MIYPVKMNKGKFSAKQLEKITNKLLENREKLKQELKTKHAAAYEWLMSHNIDLDNLQKYSKNIAAALALTNRLLLNNPQPAPAPTPPAAVSKTQTDTVTDPNSPEALAQNVWRLYGDIIDTVAKKYEIDPQLIFATIMTESEGNPLAYRFEPHLGDASYGLGQILYTTALSLGFTGRPQDIYNPEIGIDLIGRYHKNTVETYGELTPEQMTIVYNTGSLFGYPHPGHLERFTNWYYNYPDTRKVAGNPEKGGS